MAIARNDFIFINETPIPLLITAPDGALFVLPEAAMRIQWISYTFPRLVCLRSPRRARAADQALCRRRDISRSRGSGYLYGRDRAVRPQATESRPSASG